MKKSLLIALISFVGASAFATLSPSTVYFPPGPCHQMREQNMTFYNTTNAPLTNVTANVSSIGFTVASSCPFSMPPQSSCLIRVTYWPNQPGQDFGTVRINGYPFVDDEASLHGSCN